MIGRDIPNFSGVCLRINDFEGAYQATKYLTEFGHRRVAHITGILSRQDAVDRLAGYKQALADAGRGDRIQVENLSSGRVVSGTVVSSGVVHVLN